MNIIEGIRVALRGLGANKMRSFLTMLGIIIGVAAVIALLSVGRGVQVSITEQIQSAGSNLITIMPGSISMSNVRIGATGGQQAAQLTVEDARALIDAQLPSVAVVSPEFTGNGPVTYGRQTANTRIIGVWPEYLVVHNANVAVGDFISKAENDSLARVAVLGASIAANLFGEDDPIGKTILINRISFRVIGVLEAKGGAAFGSVDNAVFVPLATAQRRLFGGQRGFGVGQRVSTIAVSAVGESYVDSAIAEITEVLRAQHKTLFQQDDFTVISQKDILNIANQITSILTAFLGAIAGISLLVGGIGIMNIMLVSVSERTREIGIRKAVGAKRSDILTQFLVEAVVLSVVGGFFGIIGGWVLGQIVNQLKLGEPPLRTVISPDAVILAVGFSIAVGLFFGIYPANRAASLHPIDALRYE